MGGLTEVSIIALLVIGIALLLLPYLKKLSLPGGIEIELREEIKNIHEIQLVGEVLFNKEHHVFYWIDKNHQKRKLPNQNTASLFMTPKGAIGLSKSELDDFDTGPEIKAIAKDSFGHSENHLFVILEDSDNKKMIAYLPSWSLPHKYGIKLLSDMKEIKPEDFQNYEILR